ncbi:F0F1 ATP synthase subunit epsilon [Thermosipho sp. 1223]|uniref:F0F1 ATP synthase subunit epsilon n=1 Tax=Thermosipho sp. 1223 TaxID=1643332 RepID=UPI0009855AB2|nr:MULTISPECIES: F0F1 ATP synthase subunit epsilon [unclassified Thermosipho (in: thermotogales)]MBT1247249.1 ATP synthase F0F1 subunit epsilon [Thermosipho sp. 1244]OOC47181.1 ATP synthase F0F1 subunit epsilon [Thermosipho sp. 1223]
MRLKIYYPNGLFFDKEVDIVTVRTEVGEMGILKDRAPIIAKLKVDKVIAKKADEKFEYIVDDGFLHCDGENVIIITEDVKDKINPHEYLGG